MKACNIALIGFRATGKSLVGQLLAQRLGRVFVDMDASLEGSLGQSIQQWVHAHGWEAFRDAESALLWQLAQREGLVLATGGGVVTRRQNQEILHSGCHVVWLQASSATICQRLREDPKTASQRPALTALPLHEEVEQLLEERSSLYRATAHTAINTEGLSPQRIVAEIVASIPSHGGEHPAAEPASPRREPGSGNPSD